MNKSVAKVSLKPAIHSRELQLDQGQAPAPTPQRPSFPFSGSQLPSSVYFSIGSVDSFERKLEDAQDALGMDPHEYVPVTYTSEVMWLNELLKLTPSLLIIGAYLCPWDSVRLPVLVATGVRLKRKSLTWFHLTLIPSME